MTDTGGKKKSNSKGGDNGVGPLTTMTQQQVNNYHNDDIKIDCWPKFIMKTNFE